MNLMPRRYDDPAVPAPDLPLPDARPPEYRLRFTRAAIDVIVACEDHLGQLYACYGPTSAAYQTALHSWHRNLAALLSMNLGGDALISRDGPLSLFVRAASGLVFGLIFHGATRHCTSDGCEALINDDHVAVPARSGALVLDHKHTPSYPIGAPRPGTWSLHS